MTESGPMKMSTVVYTLRVVLNMTAPSISLATMVMTGHILPIVVAHIPCHVAFVPTVLHTTVATDTLTWATIYTLPNASTVTIRYLLSVVALVALPMAMERTPPPAPPAATQAQNPVHCNTSMLTTLVI